MKYIIEIPDDVQYVLLNGQTDNKCYTAVRPIAELEELNSDYINEHYGELQDEAYQRGFEDGKKAVSDPDRIEVGDEVTHKSDLAVWKAVCIRIDGDGRHMNLMGHTGAVGYYPVDDFKKTGKHYDIQSILEAMRNDTSTTRTVKA